MKKYSFLLLMLLVAALLAAPALAEDEFELPGAPVTQRSEPAPEDFPELTDYLPEELVGSELALIGAGGAVIEPEGDEAPEVSARTPVDSASEEQPDATQEPASEPTPTPEPPQETPEPQPEEETGPQSDAGPQKGSHAALWIALIVVVIAAAVVIVVLVKRRTGR